MIEIEESEYVRSIVAPQAILSFEWVNDRWTHAIKFMSDRRDSGSIVQAVEDLAEPADPTRVVSPSFQQVNFRRGGIGVQALLVGQSGPHHFSAVFNVRCVEDRTFIEADVADRCRSEVAALASTYQVELGPGAIDSGDPSRVVWRSDDWGAGSLSFSPWGPVAHQARFSVTESGPSRCLVQAAPRQEEGAATRRWIYRWIWESPPPPPR